MQHDANPAKGIVLQTKKQKLQLVVGRLLGSGRKKAQVFLSLLPLGLGGDTFINRFIIRKLKSYELIRPTSLSDGSLDGLEG